MMGLERGGRGIGPHYGRCGGGGVLVERRRGRGRGRHRGARDHLVSGRGRGRRLHGVGDDLVSARDGITAAAVVVVVVVVVVVGRRTGGGGDDVVADVLVMGRSRRILPRVRGGGGSRDRVTGRRRWRRRRL